MYKKAKEKRGNTDNIEQQKNMHQDNRFKPHHINITINVNVLSTLMKRQRLSVGVGKKVDPNMLMTRNILSM